MDPRRPWSYDASTLVRRVPLLDRLSESPRFNRAVVLGAIATLVAATALFAVPELIDFRAFRRRTHDQYGIYLRSDPFPVLRLLGGVVGGYVAGYLTRGRWHAALVNGWVAVLAGIVLYYVAIVYRNLSLFLAAGLRPGDAALVATLQPFLFLLVPYGAAFLVESSASSLLGNLLSNYLDAWHPGEDSEGGHSPAVRAVIALIALAVLFVGAWWLGVYVSTVDRY